MKDLEKIAGRNLRAKGYDVESYAGKYQASRGPCKSEWFSSKVELLDAILRIEKSWTYGEVA